MKIRERIKNMKSKQDKRMNLFIYDNDKKDNLRLEDYILIGKISALKYRRYL